MWWKNLFLFRIWFQSLLWKLERVTFSYSHKKGKILYWKHESCRYKLSQKKWVDWISTSWEKMEQSQKYTFWKKSPKLKNINFSHLKAIPKRLDSIFTCFPNITLIAAHSETIRPGTLSWKRQKSNITYPNFIKLIHKLNTK